jgi:hypothetical protein
MHGDDLAAGREQLGGQRRLADAWRSDDPEHPFGVRVGEPRPDLVENPLAPDETGEMLVDFRVERQRVEKRCESRLNPFEIEIGVIECAGQPFDRSLVGAGALRYRQAVP